MHSHIHGMNDKSIDTNLTDYTNYSFNPLEYVANLQ